MYSLWATVDPALLSLSRLGLWVIQAHFLSVSPEFSLECGLAFLGASLSLSLPAFGAVEILILAVGVYKAPHILISLYLMTISYAWPPSGFSLFSCYFLVRRLPFVCVSFP